MAAAPRGVKPANNRNVAAGKPSTRPDSQTTEGKPMHRPKFEIYQDRSGRYRWRLRAANGHITADSGQSYRDRYSARRAAEAVIVSLTHYVRIVDL
jgi:uncharacterized protein